MFVIFAAVALAGCTSATEEQEVETTEAALSNTGSDKPYDCAGGFCTCTGDEDCNIMFSSGVCGESAICQISPTGVPKCRCSVAFTGGGGRKPPVTKAPGRLAASVK
jgi:hypothetical protein